MHRLTGAAEFRVLIPEGLRQLFRVSGETPTEVQEVELCFSCPANRSSLDLAKNNKKKGDKLRLWIGVHPRPDTRL